MTVNFIQPIDGSQLEGAPYNPFIFIGGDRGREVHLMNQLPTDLVDPTYFGTIEDDSDEASGRYYQNSENVPWGIDMIHNFRFPVEKTRIDKAYNYFLPWGKTMGATYKDWYNDNNGYRNTSKIVFIY